MYRYRTLTYDMASSLTLERGLRVLRVLSEHPEGMTVSELAGALGTHRAGIYRLLQPHLAERLVRRREDRYLLGTGLVELASRVQPRLREVAGPLLQALADELTATAALTVRDGEDAAVVLDVRSPGDADMHITYRPGLRHPVAIAASGIAILAGGPARPSERPEVTAARALGWSRSSGELLPGATGVAAPVGETAAVSAVWIGERDEPAMARAVIATACALADAL
jgi:DNA-binding IclR family transcriptional regulator